MKLGLLVLPDAPYPELVRRWRLAEDLGFDAIHTADHTGDYRNPTGHWYDGWTTLAAMAQATARIRVGTLVANPVLHPPLRLAQKALAVADLSGGRLELGLGTGIAGFDHAAVGVPYWDVRERVARFAEYLEIVAGCLSAPVRPVRYAGRFHTVQSARVGPPAPRPTITVGGQSPTVRRAAARFADCWNTHGPFGASSGEILDVSAAQNVQLDDWCRQYGRDPASVRRSVLLFDRLDPWVGGPPVAESVKRFAAAGFGEFVIFWPPPERERELEEIARHVARQAADLRQGRPSAR